jgi:hypothetical protein
LHRGRARSNHIKPSEDERPFELRDEDVYDFKVDFADSRDTRHHTDMKVSLLDIARPAKAKGELGQFCIFSSEFLICFCFCSQGAAKGFEVVRKTRGVIPLDDDGDFEVWEDDVFDQELWGDWEQIYDEQRVDTRKSYSSVLRGNER